MNENQHEFFFGDEEKFKKLMRENETWYIMATALLDSELRRAHYALRIAKGEIEPAALTKEELITKLEDRIRGYNQQKQSADLAKRRTNE